MNSLGKQVDQFWRQVRSGELLRPALLAIVLTFNLRTFTFFPYFRPLEETWFLLCLVGFCILYPLLKLNRDWKFSGIELYLLAVSPILMVLPVVAANQEFGQPILYGVLARRSTFLILTWLVFVAAWRARWVTARSLESVMVFLAWATCWLYTFMRVFLNPNSVPDSPGFVLGSNTANASFSVPGCFITFGALYYIFRGIRERRSRFYLYALFFFWNSLGPSGRALSVTLLAVTLFFLARWRSVSSVLSLLAKFAVVASAALLLFQFLNPEALKDRITHFSDAFAVVTKGQSEDASANARAVETEIALPYIKRHPVIGSGVLSTQWNGSAEAVAAYFFPDDIGVLGVVYVYGLAGLFLFLLQYAFAIQVAFTLPSRLHSPLLDAVKGYVLYTAIYSLTTGLFVFSFEQSSFFIVLLVLLSQDAKAKEFAGRVDRQELQLSYS